VTIPAPPRPLRRPALRLSRPLALFLAAVAATAGLCGCGTGRNLLGTNASPCFVALPTAKRAVHGRGSLAGVRLVDTARLTGAGGRSLRDLLGMLPTRPPRDICVVAYAGRFTLSQVERPAGLAPPSGVGRYAIVFVGASKSELLGTFVVLHEPVSFARLHVGF
jgi:hypothetical protein